MIGGWSEYMTLISPFFLFVACTMRKYRIFFKSHISKIMWKLRKELIPQKVVGVETQLNGQVIL
ncbi:hypothetical protein FRACYDRAFT_268082 [Fragilariopsis cylindrus CCMP1102]|uniref:Uncharacterized protein n=1 Tax=Fragilariopsis cylindrus CCMP1102 TaxID=635003 RepID=A0A1E7FNS7_9STRA|nr:hypothetical protein FRACYDRAFT_268082 [Fragilariopsis cylindrus CCMP1102]|eukprot:OEU19755.1 hypothetical protein FRACYDRAFT_268082 [Fragilariopsis cylindrus CCMP1102]